MIVDFYWLRKWISSSAFVVLRCDSILNILWRWQVIVSCPISDEKWNSIRFDNFDDDDDDDGGNMRTSEWNRNFPMIFFLCCYCYRWHITSSYTQSRIESKFYFPISHKNDWFDGEEIDFLLCGMNECEISHNMMQQIPSTIDDVSSNIHNVRDVWLEKIPIFPER